MTPEAFNEILKYKNRTIETCRQLMKDERIIEAKRILDLLSKNINDLTVD